jgi:hypothetical protein
MPRWPVNRYARPDFLPEACRNKWRFQTEHLLARRQNSDIYRCKTPEATWIVKRCFEPGTDIISAPAALAEFSALERLYSAAIAAHTETLSPRPFGCIKELGIVAMSWERGQCMTHHFLKFLGTIDAAEKYGRAAGDWLERFHGLHLLPERRNDFGQKWDYLHGHIAANKLSGDHLLQQVLNVLRSRVSVASSICMPYSWIHSDFKSDNLLVDGARVIGLDPYLQHENAVIFDIVPFLIHLDLLRWHPRGLFFRRKLAAVEAGFLSGYGAITPEWKLPIGWLRCEMLSQGYVRLLLAKNGAQVGFQQRAYRQVLDHSIAKLAKISVN